MQLFHVLIGDHRHAQTAQERRDVCARVSYEPRADAHVIGAPGQVNMHCFKHLLRPKRPCATKAL